MTNKHIWIWLYANLQVVLNQLKLKPRHGNSPGWSGLCESATHLPHTHPSTGMGWNWDWSGERQKDKRTDIDLHRSLRVLQYTWVSQLRFLPWETELASLYSPLGDEDITELFIGEWGELGWHSFHWIWFCLLFRLWRQMKTGYLLPEPEFTTSCCVTCWESGLKRISAQIVGSTLLFTNHLSKEDLQLKLG